MKALSIAILWIALLTSSSAFSDPEQAKDIPTKDPCNMTFKNESWNYITVEVYNKGNRAYCDDGCPVVETFSLQRGEQYTVDVYYDICYRSKAPGMLWSDYSAQYCYSWGGKKSITVTSGGKYPRK